MSRNSSDRTFRGLGGHETGSIGRNSLLIGIARDVRDYLHESGKNAEGVERLSDVAGVGIPLVQDAAMHHDWLVFRQDDLDVIGLSELGKQHAGGDLVPIETAYAGLSGDGV